MRAFILTCCFTPFLRMDTTNQAAFEICDYLTKFCKLEVELLLPTFQANQFLFKQILQITTTVVDGFFVLNPNSSPHNPTIVMASIIFHFFFKVIQKSNLQLPISLFQPTSLLRTIRPEYEVIGFYEKAPSLLDKPIMVPLSVKRACLAIEGFMKHKLVNAEVQSVVVTINRSSLIGDAMQLLPTIDVGILTKPLHIRFIGEQSQDDGAVLQEFLSLLTTEIFSAEYGLMARLEGGLSWFLPAPSNEILSTFRFMGLVVGIAISNAVIVPVRFPLFFYNYIADRPHWMDLLIEVNPGLHKSLRETMAAVHSGALDIGDLDLFFTYDDAGRELPLCPGGESRRVTNANFDEYFEALSHMLAIGRVTREMEAFKAGFAPFCTRVFRTFAAEEVDLLVSGEPVEDWAQLRAGARYEGYEADSSSVLMFWDAFEALSEEDKRHFLFFLTGSQRAPVGGLRNVRLCIIRQSETRLLPTAHVCSKSITLPDYGDRQRMREVVKICADHWTGFGVL
jgi:hypothetical protein